METSSSPAAQQTVGSRQETTDIAGSRQHTADSRQHQPKKQKMQKLGQKEQHMAKQKKQAANWSSPEAKLARAEEKLARVLCTNKDTIKLAKQPTNKQVDTKMKTETDRQKNKRVEKRMRNVGDGCSKRHHHRPACLPQQTLLSLPHTQQIWTTQPSLTQSQIRTHTHTLTTARQSKRAPTIMLPYTHKRVYSRHTHTNKHNAGGI
jgi:hypothetical protein